MSFFDRRRRVPIDPPSWDVPPHPSARRSQAEMRRILGLPEPTPERAQALGPSGISEPPAPPIPQAPHCNGQHGTDRCDWCDALAQTITALRHQEAIQRDLDDRLSRVEYYLGMRRDGGAR